MTPSSSRAVYTYANLARGPFQVRRRTLAPLLIAVALLLPPWPGPPAALGATGEIGLLALGDSIAAGADLGEEWSYPRRLGQRVANETGLAVRYLNRSRPRERSGGVLAGQLYGLAEFAPRLVTLTVGANDYLVPSFECVASRIDDVPALSCNPPDLSATTPTLESNLRQILDRLTSETDASIAVTTYYNPYPRGSPCAPGVADLSVRYVNAAISRVVAEFGERATLVDLMLLFRGHEGRAPVGWFAPSPLSVLCLDIHPNAEGQSAIASAVWDAIGSRLRGLFLSA